MDNSGLIFHSGMLSDPFDFWGKQANWEIIGQWSGGQSIYIAQVKANSANTLEQLALLITGDKADWKLIGLPNSVAKEQIVNVALLLTKIEERLRDNVIKAIDKIGIYFGSVSAVVDISANPAKTLNQYFDGLKKKSEYRDCDGAVRLVYAKAVLDLLTLPVFNALDYSDSSIPIAEPMKGKLISDLRKGDRAYFRNYNPDYKIKFPYGPYEAENVIKYDDDKFWGHPGGVLSENDWYEELKKQFNAPSPENKPIGNQRTDRVPGFDGDIQFLDIVKVANDAFIYRRMQQAKQRRKTRVKQ